jgi:EH domain-containing protein 1
MKSRSLTLLLLFFVLFFSPPTLCTGATVQAWPRLRLTQQQLGRLALSLRKPLRLSGGEDDSDSDSDEVAKAPRAPVESTAGVDHISALLPSAAEEPPVRDVAADNVLELVKERQTQLDKDKVFAGLRSLYLNKVKPLEEASWYSFFHPGATLDASDFDAKPIVLLLGQYSVGKTSFIRSLLGRDFQGMRIGPEPTTDQFMAVMHGNDERIVPGHALCMRKDSPFHGLADFGNNFLSRFAGTTSNSALLANITLIDTPGVLSGRKQRDGRDYDYSAVVEWFASRADMIIFMFDAHKLDISDELRGILDKIRPHQDKVRIILNKVQTIDTQQLLRVYGALMWSLGEVLRTPEVPRVYMGSFWDQDDSNTANDWRNSNVLAELLIREKAELVRELCALPQNTIMRRVSSLVKRARAVKVHAFIIHYIRKQIAGWATVTVWDKGAKQKELVEQLERNFPLIAQVLVAGSYGSSSLLRY